MLIIILVLINSIFAYSSDFEKPYDLVIRSEADSEEGFLNKISIGDRHYSAVILDFEKDDKTVFSIYTPYAAAGRIKTAGLLREIKNPAGQYPGSSLFREKTGIIPDRSLNHTGSSGMVITAGNWCSLFCEEGESDRSTLDWSGIYSNYEIIENISVSFSVSEYSERDDSKNDVWYSDRETGYGREIINTAVSGSYKSKNNITGIDSAAAVTLCDGMENGLFFRASPYLLLSFLRADILAAGTSSSYIKPDGSYPSTAFRKGLSLSFFSKKIIPANLKLRYLSDSFHENYSDENYCGYSDEYAAALSLSHSFILAGASFKIRNIYKNELFENYTDGGLSVGVKSGKSRVIFERKESYKDGMKYADSLRLEAGCRGRYLELYLLGKLKKSDCPEKSVKSRIRLKSKNAALFSEISILNTGNYDTDTENRVIYSSGFEIRF